VVLMRGAQRSCHLLQSVVGFIGHLRLPSFFNRTPRAIAVGWFYEFHPGQFKCPAPLVHSAKLCIAVLRLEFLDGRRRAPCRLGRRGTIRQPGKTKCVTQQIHFGLVRAPRFRPRTPCEPACPQYPRWLSHLSPRQTPAASCH
jgi:hypothetical protein